MTHVQPVPAVKYGRSRIVLFEERAPERNIQKRGETFPVYGTPMTAYNRRGRQIRVDDTTSTISLKA
jgi:hypothetical protein